MAEDVYWSIFKKDRRRSRVYIRGVQDIAAGCAKCMPLCMMCWAKMMWVYRDRPQCKVVSYRIYRSQYISQTSMVIMKETKRRIISPRLAKIHTVRCSGLLLPEAGAKVIDRMYVYGARRCKNQARLISTQIASKSFDKDRPALQLFQNNNRSLAIWRPSAAQLDLTVLYVYTEYSIHSTASSVVSPTNVSLFSKCRQSNDIQLLLSNVAPTPQSRRHRSM